MLISLPSAAPRAAARGVIGASGKLSKSAENGILSAGDLRSIAKHAVARDYPKKTFVVTEGERTDSLYIIVSGRVRVFVSDRRGKEITLNTQGPGEYFGEIILDEGPRSASVITIEPTRLLVVTKREFSDLVALSPEFTMNLIRKLARRVRALTENVKSLALMDVYGRVARLLLDLAEQRDGKLIIDRCPTQKEMASQVGASREMISRIMKELSEGRYLVVDRRMVSFSRPLPKAW